MNNRLFYSTSLLRSTSLSFRSNPWAQSLGKFTSITDSYDSLVRKGLIEASESQRRVAHQCVSIYDNRAVLTCDVSTVPELSSSSFSPSSFLKSIQDKFNFTSLNSNKEISTAVSKTTQGVYLYGGVGVGKTMIMDLFELIPCDDGVVKRRVHLHSFLSFLREEIHKETLAQRSFLPSKRTSPMSIVAKRITLDSPVLCFDEFQTFDVADAALLASFFTYAFHYGIFLFATSNKAPEELFNTSQYFDSFIPLLLHHCVVVKMEGEDYRQRNVGVVGEEKFHKNIYLTPNGETNTHAILKMVQNGFKSPIVKWEQGPTGISAFGRELMAPMFANGVVVYRFSNFSSDESMFGPVEFQLIARNFHTVVLLDVPQIGAISKDAAKQFIILVDELYQHKVKLLMTISVPWTKVLDPSDEEDKRQYYTVPDDDRGGFYSNDIRVSNRDFEEVLSFSRIESRLSEMSSMEYLLAPHTEFVVNDFNFSHFLVEPSLLPK